MSILTYILLLIFSFLAACFALIYNIATLKKLRRINKRLQELEKEGYFEDGEVQNDNF